jgi:glycosyltransferase involved in cell wall biosynthesis
VHDNPVSPTWFDRRAARTPPDLVIANSRFTATAAAKLFQGVSVEVLYHPVEEPNLADRHEVRRAVRASLGTDRNAVVVLQASRLEEWKGQAVHLDALARLKEVPGWEAWFAGGGQKPGEQEYLNTLRTRAERAGIGNRVRFLGQRSDVPRLMAAADVYCQPNTGPEPFGIVYVEALYAGLPAVASDFGGSAEIVDETCGLLAPPGDANAVAKLLGELVRNPKLRSTLGQCGPRRAAQLCDPGLALSRLSEYVFADALVKA